jgi:hypothetical protein
LEPPGYPGRFTAALQEELRQIQSRINRIENQTDAVSGFLLDTPWENRAALDLQLSRVSEEILTSENALREPRRREEPSDDVASVRSGILATDRSLAELTQEIRKEEDSIAQLNALKAQLHTQSSRLTRAIVAEEKLLDYEFTMCPRCGTSLPEGRGGENQCLLCLQQPSIELKREDLVREQDRIGSQILETQELVSQRSNRLIDLRRRLTQLGERRATLGHELDVMVSSYVSDQASAIAAEAAKRAELLAQHLRLQDYRKLFEKMDLAASESAQLQGRRDDILNRLEIATNRTSEAEARVLRLEQKFEQILERFHAPRFADPPTARIDRRTFLPIVDGRRPEELSSQGLMVLVNVAHALAHHLTALELGLPLPGILLIDGLTSNVGHQDEDLERVRGVYQYLMEVSDELGDSLQLIVADNDVPEYASQRIVTHFSEEDRLIPTTALR